MVLEDRLELRDRQLPGRLERGVESARMSMAFPAVLRQPGRELEGLAHILGLPVDIAEVPGVHGHHPVGHGELGSISTAFLSILRLCS